MSARTERRYLEALWNDDWEKLEHPRPGWSSFTWTIGGVALGLACALIVILMMIGLGVA